MLSRISDKVIAEERLLHNSLLSIYFVTNFSYYTTPFSDVFFFWAAFGLLKAEPHSLHLTASLHK